jgi:hypothetical protein
MALSLDDGVWIQFVEEHEQPIDDFKGLRRDGTYLVSDGKHFGEEVKTYSCTHSEEVRRAAYAAPSAIFIAGASHYVRLSLPLIRVTSHWHWTYWVDLEYCSYFVLWSPVSGSRLKCLHAPY